jgi:TonB family protein
MIGALALLAGTAGGVEFWDERPIKVIQTSVANFPPALTMQGVYEAEARVVILVDADGKLQDYLVAGYSHPEIVPEAIASLRAWTYEPARRRGEPVGTRAEIALRFEARGAVLSLSSVDSITVNLNRLAAKPMTSLVCKLSELDAPPQRIETVTPRHPGKNLPRSHARATASVDFYIDAAGRPRMPVVTRATHELFGAAAVEALEQWRFAPPTRDGEPVIVRVVQEFVFADPT